MEPATTETPDEVDSIELLRQRVFAGAMTCLAFTGCLLIAFVSLLSVIAILGYGARAFYTLAIFIGAVGEGAMMITVIATIALAGLGILAAIVSAGVFYDRIRAAVFGEEFMKRNHLCCNSCGVYVSTKAKRYSVSGNTRDYCPCCHGKLQ